MLLPETIELCYSLSSAGPPRHPGLLPGQQVLTPQQQLLIYSQQQQILRARLAAALKLQQHHPGQAYLPAAHPVQQAHTHQQQALAQQQQRFEKNSPPNAVMASQPQNLMTALQQYHQAAAVVAAANQQGLLSRLPGKVAGNPYGNEVTAPPLPPPHIQQQLANFHQYSKTASLVHAQQQRTALSAHPMMPHPQPVDQGQQMMERQQREMGPESTKSGLSISATPFIPTSNTPPAPRQFTGTNPTAGEGIPPPPVSAVPVVGHVTRPSAPLLQQVIVPHHHMVATPPGGMLPFPRPHPQQMHVSNPAQFQHQPQRKTSATSAPSQGQSLLGGPFQVIDKPHHPTGSVHRQHSGEGNGASGAKPPPGLSLPIRQNVMTEQGTTPTAPGVVMASIEMAARTMAINRSGHALVNSAPLTIAAGYRPQHPHQHLQELTSLYGAPPKLPANVSTGGNKRALLPTPTAAGPIPTYHPGSTHHHIATPTPNVPPGWPGGSMRIPPHRVPPPVTNPSGHRQQVIYSQEQQQVVQRSNFTGRGNGM